MANQIVVSAGAKVRNLDGVLTGTSGVVNSLPINASNGIPQLDVNGKILVSQLPNSVMEYQGTWNANTNTPTLVNGTGNQGDVYLCNVAGTVDFGAGPIAFVVGDQVIYSGSIWQRASGATGTVTSVAITESGDSLNITGSPITTSGTINIGFNGTNLQYVNGAGNLTTFPTLITSIGLSMPSAFSVANSPLTANGTIAVTGAGYASQYIRGDGTLADFPSSGGGGSSVSYYLNGGTSQGTIGGTTYYEMSKTADTGTGVDFTKSGDGFIVAFLTDANDPAQLNIPAGNWNYEIYASMSANGGTPQMYAELYKYDGTTFTLISTSSNEILYDGTNLNLYTFGMTVPATTLTLTDRLAIKLYATNSGGKTTTVHTQDSHLCQVITTFSTGITALNGLTAQVQYFQTGTSGTDFNISSTTATHTFNLPTASATNRGALSSADWSTFNGKENNLTFYSPLVKSGSSVTIPPATSIANGYLTSTDWSTFNSKQAALSGTGFVKISGTTISYDNSTYALDSDVVKLTGNQTIGGTKTFSLATKNNSGILLSDTSSTAAPSGYISLAGYNYLTNKGLLINLASQTYLFLFNTAAGNNYTFPNATGTIALTSDLTGGTVTSVAALTIGTTGTDLSSSVANSTTTPVITLNVPTASATNRGALSSADWTTFNNKQSALTNPVTGTGTTNYLPKFTGTSTIGNSIVSESGAAVNVAGSVTANSTSGISGIFTSSNFFGSIDLENTGGTATGKWNLQAVSGAQVGGAAGSSFGIYSYGASSYRLFINSSGNVGIGTTSPLTLLHIASSSASFFTIDAGTSSNSGVSFYRAGSPFGAIYYLSTNTMRFDVNNAIAMLIDSSANTSIGYTTNPSLYKLDVNGTGRFTRMIVGGTATSRILQVNTSGNDGIRILTSGDNPTLDLMQTAAANAAARNWRIVTNWDGWGTMDFQSGTNNTNDPSTTRLSISGTTGAATFSGTVNTPTKYTWGTANDGTTGQIATDNTNNYLDFKGNLYFRGAAASNTLITFTSAGAATFSSSVTAGGTIATNDGFYSSRAGSDSIGSGAYVQLANNGFIQANASGGVDFWTLSGSWQQRMRITSGGNVLIGTTTDATGKLQVNGTVYATGFYESSDIRFKNVLETNPNINLSGIDVIKFTRKDNDINQVRYGYSAQQVQSILPDLVTGIDFLNVNYLDVHTLKIAQLEQEIKELKAKLN